jgi:carbamoylphosphate synthase small subunit
VTHLRAAFEVALFARALTPPQAAPGPHDADGNFEPFVRWMVNARSA